MADVAQPAQLLYLVIINPTLKPPAPTDDDDDYEQASILFYTSHSRAVSRDTMLRQVGLAKALINFSELFTPEAGCDNVHSQKKRMIMLSPEQNFWIHICVQVPTETRPPPASQKTSKSKSNASSKGKGKETPPPPTIEYVDSGLHDSVLRADLQAAYEGFRLVHGTFQEILDSKGIATLEGLLEQYFNVWAWKWDVNVPLDLPLHLGTPLHPKHSRLQPIMEELCAGMPSSSSSFVLYHNPPSLIAPPYTRLSSTTIEGETSLAEVHNGQVEEKEEKNAEERDVRALITYMLTLTQPKLLPTTSSSLGSNNIDALSNTQPAGNGSLHSRIASLSDSTSTIIPPAPSTLSSATIRPHPPSQQASSSTAASIVNGLLPTSISGTPTPSPSPSSTSISPSLPANPLSTALAIPGARPLSQLGSTMAAPFTHAGSYIVHNANPRKWWPDYLTIPTGSTKGGSAGVAEKDKEKEEQEQGTTTTAASTDVPSSAPADGAIGDQEPSAAPTTTDSTEEIGKDTETKTDADSDEGDDDEESEAESGEGDVAVADASPNAAANDEDTSAAIPDPASRWDSPRVVVEQDDESEAAEASFSSAAAVGETEADPGALTAPSTPSREPSIIDQDALEDAMLDSAPPRNSEGSDAVAPYPSLPLSPVTMPFSRLTVRMRKRRAAADIEENEGGDGDEGEEIGGRGGDAENETEQRDVLYLTDHGLTFVLLTPPQSLGEAEVDGEAEYEHLEEFVDEHLRSLRRVLSSDPSMAELLLPVSSSVPSRAVILDETSKTTSTVPLSSTSKPYTGAPHLFAAYNSFQRNPWINEIIARSTSNQWFASRRVVANTHHAPSASHSNVSSRVQSPAPWMASPSVQPPRTGTGAERLTVLLEGGNTQASLVDVDSELSSLIRQRVQAR